MGGVNKSATYVSTASNANILVFSYTIASGDTATTGMALPVVSLMLPAFKDKAVVVAVMPVVAVSPLAIV
jgi:hypothetical protein